MDVSLDIETLHQKLCVNGATSAMADWLCALWAQVQELQEEVRILRGED